MPEPIKPPMPTDTSLRELDVAIARLRGWEWRTVEFGESEWVSPPDLYGLHDCRESDTPDSNPPPFASEWAFAGPLAEQLPPEELHLLLRTSGKLTPTAIALAWYAWETGTAWPW